MDNNQSPLLHFILWIAFGTLAMLVLDGCTNQPTATVLTAQPSIDIKPTSSASPGPEAQIEDYIVQEIAGSETEHRYIVRVSANGLRAPLPMTEDVIQKCWLYQDGALGDCLAGDFVDSVDQEGTGAWDYSYVIFSIVNMDPESGRATVRLDELAGPQARKGLLYTLVRVNGSWQTESSKLLWSS